MLINEMAAAAGFQNKLDPLLMQCIQGLPKQVHTYFRFRQLNNVCFENLREIENDPNFSYNRNMMTSTLSLVYSWFLWQFQFQNWPDQNLPNLKSNWILMQIIYTVWQWLSIRFLDACSGEKIIIIFTEKIILS